MAMEGPLLASARRLLREFGQHVFDLPQIPLPVRLWREERGAEMRIDLQIALGGTDRDEQERKLGELARQGLVWSAWHGPTVSGWVETDGLDRLLAADVDAFVEAANTMRPALDLSVPEVWRRPASWEGPPCAGDGVIVGIVDSGIDLTHPSFQRPEGGTRVLSYWSQSASNLAMPPAPYGYGTEWDRAEIDRLLAAQTALPSAWIDPTGHGTKVAGVAAGNGRGIPSSRYLGLAPNADLIVVALESRRGAFPSTANAIDAIQYVFERAYKLGKRAVVNLSQGVQIGAHQPADRLETALSALLDADDNHLVVVSAGNTGDADAHARFSLNPGASFDLPLVVPRQAGPHVLVDLWYDVAERLFVEIVDPEGSGTPAIEDQRPGNGQLGNDLYEVDGVPNVLGVGANQLQVKLRGPSSAGDVRDGRWALRLSNRAGASGRPIDAWLDRGLGPSPPRFEPAHSLADSTITSPATARGAIAVGAYSMSPTVGPLSPSSGRGPDRTQAPVEMLVAPGGPVTTTDSRHTGATDFAPAYGTSFAAPHVTGAVALMLEATPAITRDQVLHCLQRTAHADGDTNAGPASAWGAGKLDVSAALACATQSIP